MYNGWVRLSPATYVVVAAARLFRPHHLSLHISFFDLKSPYKPELATLCTHGRLLRLLGAVLAPTRHAVGDTSLEKEKREY